MIRYTNELLFWFHLALLSGAVMSGFLLPWPAIVMLIILHRLHVWVFGGCLISRIQEKLGGIPEDTSFIQLVTRKFFGLEITQRQSHVVDYCLVLITFALASTNHLVSL